MRHRHLDYPAGTSVHELGRAALDDLLNSGDLQDWAPLAAAIGADPYGELADRVLALCTAHEMYGTSRLWPAWIERLRRGPTEAPQRLAALRASRGFSQVELASRVGMTQSDLSKLERRNDCRVSTLRRYVAATGGRLRLYTDYPDTSIEIALQP